MWSKSRNDIQCLRTLSQHGQSHWTPTCWCVSCCAWTRSGCCPHTWPRPCRPSPASHPSAHHPERCQRLGPGGCRSDQWSFPSNEHHGRKRNYPTPPCRRSCCTSLSGCHWRGWCPGERRRGQRWTKQLCMCREQCHTVFSINNINHCKTWRSEHDLTKMRWL